MDVEIAVCTFGGNEEPMSAEILRGDCLEVMASVPEESVEAIVTDPPYGLGFMGKKWDELPPGPEFAAAALRVLKPGGHLLAFGGTRTYHRLTVAIEDAGFEIRDCLSWLYGSGFPKSHNLKGDWEGFGTALKPSWEPIIMARKPLSGTVASNVLGHGTGALNIDGCRIGYESEAERLMVKNRSGAGGPTMYGGGKSWKDSGEEMPSGRWPANTALDEQAAAMLDEQVGELKAGVAVRRNGGGQAIFGGINGRQNLRGSVDDMGYGGSGGPSRFFYVAKASRKERNAGLDDRNTHPTVKPINLMRWLVRMVTPPGGTVLDPFTGSGTTGCAAVLEGFDFVGIEREPEYADIAEARIEHFSGERRRRLWM